MSLKGVLRILIADDHELLRDTLTSYLSEHSDFAITAVGDLDEAVQALQAGELFDLILLDYAMPGMHGLEGLSKLLEMRAGTRVALMSGMAPRWVVEQALALGAQGFVPKSMPAASLQNVIRFMAAGERYMPPEYLVQPAVDPYSERSVAQDLTRRENEVLRALCLGKTNKEIARDLGLKEPTIKLHVKTLYRRLGASNRTQAAMIAKERGLL